VAQITFMIQLTNQPTNQLRTPVSDNTCRPMCAIHYSDRGI